MPRITQRRVMNKKEAAAGVDPNAVSRQALCAFRTPYIHLQKEVLMAQTQTEAGTIAGYFESSSQAREAVDALRDAGFTSAHLGVAHRGSTSGSTTTSNTAAKAGEKAGNAWESVKNFFSGNTAEPYAGERSEGDLGTREITGTPGGSYGSEDQYDNSDLHQSFSGLSVPEDRSRYLGHRLGSGHDGAVVTVNAKDRAAEAEAILRRFGADLGDTAASYDYSQKGETTGTADNQNIQLLGEVLRVHKDRISRGEVRLRKETITETQTVQVPVTREELVIERHAVGQNTPATGSIGQNEEIRIPLTEERASIDKSTFVREEVSVGKKSVEDMRNLSDDVRHEELVVEDSTKQRA